MELADLMVSIANKQVPRLNIWFGEEQGIIDKYLEQLIALGYKKHVVESVSQAVSLTTKRSFDKSPKLFIVSNDKEFTGAESKWQTIADTFNSSKNILVARYTKLDKTRKFYKQNKDACVEFKHLSADILSKYIKAEADLNEGQCDELCTTCSNDYNRIMLELDKVVQYSASHCITGSDAYEVLMNEGDIYTDIGDITFKLTDSIVRGEYENSMVYLDKARRSGEPVLRITSILYNNFRNMLALLCLGSNKQNASARTRLEGRIVAMTIKQLGAYSIADCIRNMNICQQVESGIKMGKIDEEIALEYLVINLLK